MLMKMTKPCLCSISGGTTLRIDCPRHGAYSIVWCKVCKSSVRYESHDSEHFKMSSLIPSPTIKKEKRECDCRCHGTPYARYDVYCIHCQPSEEREKIKLGVLSIYNNGLETWLYPHPHPIHIGVLNGMLYLNGGAVYKRKTSDHNEDILVKTNSFEKFLQSKHAESYTGTDDDMPDTFEHWLSELEVEDLIQYGNEAMFQLKKGLEKI